MTQQVHNTVFISYRRSSSSYLARAIYMDLKYNGYDVFMDVESIDSGKFDQIILRQIEARAHFLILCTPGTFDRINEHGDWLRREIEHAMECGRNVVPVMASDFKFDDAVKKLLRGDLKALPSYNAVNVPHDYFDEAMERLRARFLKLPVGVTLATTPAADVHAVAAKQAVVESQPAPTPKELTAEEYFNRAYARGDADPDARIADYSEAIRLNPEYFGAYNNRGIAYDDKGDFGNALADYTRAISLNPQYATAYYNRGLVYQRMDDLDTALADFDRAVRLKPDYADAHYWRGNMYEAKQDWEQAAAAFERYIELTSANPDPTWTPKAQEHLRELQARLKGE
jgi:Flp pilus assembly protein TadD